MYGPTNDVGRPLQLTRRRQGTSIATAANNGAAPLNSLGQNGTQLDATHALPFRQAPGMNHQARRQDQSHQLALEGEIESPQTAQMSESLAAMSASDRYGLTGLLHMIRNEGSDIGAIAIGQDLTALGLDLSQPEYGQHARIFSRHHCPLERFLLTCGTWVCCQSPTTLPDLRLSVRRSRFETDRARVLHSAVLHRAQRPSLSRAGGQLRRRYLVLHLLFDPARYHAGARGRGTVRPRHLSSSLQLFSRTALVETHTTIPHTTPFFPHLST